MEELVGDGQMNWGRVVSLFTFTGVLVRELQGEDTDQGLGNGMELGGKESCRALAETIADYLGEEKSDWMLENKGWVGLSSKHHTHALMDTYAHTHTGSLTKLVGIRDGNLG
jgi:hypothetical protein